MTDQAPATVAELNGGTHTTAFAAPLVDLAVAGYRQQEYVVEGTATGFRAVGDFGFDGRWKAEPATTAPFRTRMVVTAPADNSKFNGTVVAEWNNVTAGFDITLADTPELFELGYAHVAISAQYVGVHGHEANPAGLRTWDPERYGSLSHPGDRFSYDIFTQAAALLGSKRPTGGVDPLAGLTVRKLLGIGGSQSAGRLATYVNAVAPLGHPFDGIVLAVYFGSGSSLEDNTVMNITNVDPDVQFERPVGTQLRTDLGIPLMVVNSETETLPCFPVRQPDTDRFRYWEAAGTAHANVPEMMSMMGKMMRDGGGMPAMPEGAAMPEMPPLCAVAWKPVASAAVDHVHRWMLGGPPPPVQPLIQVTGDGTDLVRDANGIALGGIRLPDVEVPLAAHTGVNGLGGMMVLNGASVPFTPEVVASLYRDRNDYLAKYDEALKRALEAEVLLPASATALRQQAEQVPWPA